MQTNGKRILQGSQEFKKGLLIFGRKTPKRLRDLACLAAVAQDSVEERHRSTVVQQPGAESDAPQGRGADLVPRLLKCGF